MSLSVSDFVVFGRSVQNKTKKYRCSI